MKLGTKPYLWKCVLYAWEQPHFEIETWGNSEMAYWTARIFFRFCIFFLFSVKVAKAHAH